MDEPEDPIEPDGDWVPWTGRPMVDYQLALGAFLVTFNRIENGVSDLIGIILKEADRPDKIKEAVKRQLMQRVEILEWLLIHRPDAPYIPTPRIKALADKRASLAHGHFDENPFTGDYQIVGKGERYDWTPVTIEPLIEEAREIDKLLMAAKVHLWFDDIPDDFVPKPKAPKTE